MPKSEIIADVLGRVSAETEISEELMLSRCRRQEVVDARHMAIMLLCVCGIYISQIAATFGVSPRSVYSAKTDFDSRVSYNRPLKISYERILKKLRCNFEAVLS